MSNTISNMDDVIDSRDVIARIEELESSLSAAHESDNGDLPNCGSPFEAWLDAQVKDDTDHADDANELQILRTLNEEAEGCADWKYGETLIRDSYFQDYAKQLADDCGLIVEGATWPNNCIDWERAARELKYDYTSVDFDGVTYWVRS